MFNTTQTSMNFSFRENMICTLEEVFFPWDYKFHRQNPFSLEGGNYLYINASQMEFLEYDYIRFLWMEKLKIIQLYLFIVIPESEEQFVFSKKLVLRNRWMYDQVTKVIAANRIAVIGRSHSTNIFGLPTLPKEYQVLQVTTKPPKFKEVGWDKFHKELQTALIKEYTSC